MLDPPHSLHWLLRRWCWQMLAPPHSLHWLLRRWCWHRCSLRHIPCMCSSGAGAGRCSSRHTPCIDSLCAGAGRCSIRHIPCMRSSGAGAGTSCSVLHVPECSGSFCLILHVGVSCSTQSRQTLPLAYSAFCLLGLPNQPSWQSFAPPSRVCNLAPAAIGQSLKRIAWK